MEREWGEGGFRNSARGASGAAVTTMILDPKAAFENASSCNLMR